MVMGSWKIVSVISIFALFGNWIPHGLWRMCVCLGKCLASLVLMMLTSAPSSKRSLNGLSLMKTVVYLSCECFRVCFDWSSRTAESVAPMCNGGRWMGGACWRPPASENIAVFVGSSVATCCMSRFRCRCRCCCLFGCRLCFHCLIVRRSGRHGRCVVCRFRCLYVRRR